MKCIKKSIKYVIFNLKNIKKTYNYYIFSKLSFSIFIYKKMVYKYLELYNYETQKKGLERSKPFSV